MAEQEVIKHTKKIFGIWSSKNSFIHKFSEFLLEIIIIVFAVSLSIYLHDRSELKHQHHETQEFMLGLKQDLQTDIREMKGDKESFTKSAEGFGYITSRKLKETLKPDSINFYLQWIFNTTGLVPNDGRFEGFKSSGKIGTIGDKELQNDIMDLYQENIPNLMASSKLYTLKKEKLFDYVYDNAKRVTDTTSNLVELLATDKAYNISISLSSVTEIIERYDLCISKMQTIIETIDKEYVE